MKVFPYIYQLYTRHHVRGHYYASIRNGCEILFIPRGPFIPSKHETLLNSRRYFLGYVCLKIFISWDIAQKLTSTIYKWSKLYSVLIFGEFDILMVMYLSNWNRWGQISKMANFKASISRKWKKEDVELGKHIDIDV